MQNIYAKATKRKSTVFRVEGSNLGTANEKAMQKKRIHKGNAVK
jgi:hypothetical protein